MQLKFSADNLSHSNPQKANSPPVGLHNPKFSVHVFADWYKATHKPLLIEVCVCKYIIKGTAAITSS